MFVFEMLDVFAEKMRAVKGRHATPVKLTDVEFVWECVFCFCTTLEKVAAILAGRRYLKPVVIARKAREGLEHFVCNRFGLVDNDSHLGAGLVEWVTTFRFAGIICHETFDLATCVVAGYEKLYDLEYLSAIRNIDLFADVLYVLIRLIFKLLVRR